MYFYDFVFDDNKIVFPEHLMGQLVVLNDDFTIDTIMYDENYYGRWFWGVYATSNEYIFTIYNSRIIKKFIKKSKSFVDVEIKDIPKESEGCFRHDEIFVHKNKIIIVTHDNELLVSDLNFSEIQYVKSIHKGKPHMQIVEDDEFLYIPIEKTIYQLSKDNMDINIFAQFDQTIDVLFRNVKGLWTLTNDAQLKNLDASNYFIDLSNYIHFYGDRERGQFINFIKAYCYDEKVLFVPCYCDNLLIFDSITNQITELVIEKEIENEKTLSRDFRKNIQKYIASYQKGQYVFFLSSSSEILYSFDMETLLYTECPQGVTDKSLIEIEMKHKKTLIEQLGAINLENYIDYVSSK